MATEDSNSGDFNPFTPQFQPYKDFPELTHVPLPGHLLANFASSVRRIAGGCQVIVDLLHHEQLDDIDRDGADPHCTPPMLGDFHRGQLQLLVSASLEALSVRAAELAEWAYDTRTEAGLQASLERVQQSLAAMSSR